jgi:hypothetical protein
VLVVGVIERKVLLPHDLAAFGRNDLTHLLVQRVRPYSGPARGSGAPKTSRSQSVRSLPQ